MTSRYPDSVGSHRRFSGLLAATAVGVYLLVVLGATTALTDAAASCPTWPACNGELVPSVSDPMLLLAWVHRVVAMIVAALVVASTLSAWLGSATGRVRGALAVATIAYPVQIALGAVSATTGPPAVAGVPYETLSAVHLGLGVLIFAAVILALSWTLETETASEGDWTALVDPEPVADDAGERPAVPTATVPRAIATGRAYVSMTKPRLMWLLCLVAAAGMALASTFGGGYDLTLRTVAVTLAGGVLSIGSSGTFNHVLERDVDRKMDRTADRPLAVDLIPVSHALTFGVVLGVASVALFASVNALVAVLGLTAIVFYSVVYTVVLKPNFVSNTVIGGAAGALPALIGWAAVTASIDVPGLVLAGVIFLWTPAHFYNLALAYKEDYARGGFPMLPVIEGEAPTRKHIVWYLAATLVGASVLALVTELGVLYAVTSTVLGGLFLYYVIALHYEQTERAAFRAFHASNAYLGALLVAIVVDSLVV